ncbi:hypothetical protein [Vibrio sp. ER1A]|uniref:hypothetical protein n=1 Tax=Vibrio sp. ER1A TaxID=1517681 RepID=UPI0004DD40CC|nr:hypothetical protein [Vibrio sp. ER1A]KFA99229.1 hypothetical protein HW45_05070 [Vibrio sp. ER1A]
MKNKPNKNQKLNNFKPSRISSFNLFNNESGDTLVFYYTAGKETRVKAVSQFHVALDLANEEELKSTIRKHVPSSVVKTNITAYVNAKIKAIKERVPEANVFYVGENEETFIVVGVKEVSGVAESAIGVAFYKEEGGKRETRLVFRFKSIEGTDTARFIKGSTYSSVFKELNVATLENNVVKPVVTDPVEAFDSISCPLKREEVKQAILEIDYAKKQEEFKKKEKQRKYAINKKKRESGYTIEAFEAKNAF